jgi:hypothetical protein
LKENINEKNVETVVVEGLVVVVVLLTKKYDVGF